MTVQSLRVLIVDDHPVVRTGLRSILGQSDVVVLVGEAGGVIEALAQAEQLEPDIVLTDLRLPDGSGLQIIKALTQSRPLCRSLVLTTYVGDELVHSALEAGAVGFISKSYAEPELLCAIEAVAAGRRYFSADVSAALVAFGPRVMLTVRERAVLEALAEGLRNREIGKRLGMSEATARTHVERILDKFDCRDRGRAVAIAQQRGFFDCAPTGGS